MRVKCDSIIKILQKFSALSELHIRLNDVTKEAANDIAAVILNNQLQKLPNS